MANLEQYIYEEVLTDRLKLNSLSNKLGKISLQLINNFNKVEVDSSKYNVFLNELKKIRVDILESENMYYSRELSLGELKKALVKYYKKVLANYKNIVDNLKEESLSKSQIDRLSRGLEKLKEFLIDMKKTIEIMWVSMMLR